MATGAAPPDALSSPLLAVGLRWRRVFPGQERQLGVLRRWLAELLPPCDARDDVTAVATELGSNAVKHTASGQGQWFAVEVTSHPAVVRVAVADCGGPSEPQVIDDPAAEYGRGLLVVQAMAVRTGVTGDQRGRLVWADIPWAGPQTPALAHDPYEGAIRDGHAALATRFGGVPAWFGRSTLQWWALPSDHELVTAPTAQELAVLLSRVIRPQPREARETRRVTQAATPAGHHDRPGICSQPAQAPSRPASRQRGAFPGRNRHSGQPGALTIAAAPAAG